MDAGEGIDVFALNDSARVVLQVTHLALSDIIAVEELPAA